MVALEIHQKLLNGLYEQAKPAQVAHIGEDMDRVESLLGDIDLEHLGKRRDDFFKDNLVEAPFDQDIAHVPESLGADISGGVRRACDVQGIMPLEIIGKLIYGFFVGQVVHLLEDHETQHGVKFLGRRSENRIVFSKYLLDWQRGKNMLPKYLCPGFFNALFAFRSQEGKGIEHVGGFVILDVDHSGSFIANCDAMVYHKTPCAATVL